ncbi:hypothetical protein RKD42_004270 [Streptomyces ambofaciens]
MEGIAKYASTCSALFHMRVATRSSSPTARSSRSACASWAARAPISAKERRCGSSSPVQVVTCELPWMLDPWSRILEISSGTSCIVLSTVSSRGDIAYAAVRVALILRTYRLVCH